MKVTFIGHASFAVSFSSLPLCVSGLGHAFLESVIVFGRAKGRGSGCHGAESGGFGTIWGGSRRRRGRSYRSTEEDATFQRGHSDSLLKM